MQILGENIQVVLNLFNIGKKNTITFMCPSTGVILKKYKNASSLDEAWNIVLKSYRNIFGRDLCLSPIDKKKMERIFMGQGEEFDGWYNEKLLRSSTRQFSFSDLKNFVDKEEFLKLIEKLDLDVNVNNKTYLFESIAYEKLVITASSPTHALCKMMKRSSIITSARDRSYRDIFINVFFYDVFNILIEDCIEDFHAKNFTDQLDFLVEIYILSYVDFEEIVCLS